MNMIQILAACALLATGADDSQADMKLGEMLSAPRWAIAPEISWFHYEEPGVMEEEGTFYGVAACYTRFYRAQYEDGIFRVEGGFSVGDVDYDGALMDGTPYEMAGNDDYLANARILLGPLWHADTWANHLYAGFGYRYLQDDSTHDPHGYRRHSNYFYLPLGLKAYRTMNDNWYLELGGEVDLLIAGLQVSEIPESPTDPSNVENWQWPGVGLRGALALRHKTASSDLSLAPFVQYWWVDDSRPSSSRTWYEPRNWSLQAGVNLIVRF